MNLDELSKEYCDLLSQSEDEDFITTQEEDERLKELKKLNDSLNDMLYFPTKARDAVVVADEQEDLENYGMQYVADMMEGRIPEFMRQHIDYKSIAEDALTDWMVVEFEGTTYYVEENY